MNDAVSVRGPQSVGDLDGVLQRTLDRKGTLGENLRECLTVDILHYQIRQAVNLPTLRALLLAHQAPSECLPIR